MKPLLEVSHVSYSYHTLAGETPALSDITFSVDEGEFLAIVGPSGCGKSTLLSLLSGLLTPEQGIIHFSDSPLSTHQTNIGYMLQKDHLFEWRTVYRNVILGLEIQNRKTEENLAHVEQMLRDYGLSSFKNSRPSELSGGMRQRVMIAMALACEPDILIADEPTTALDVTIQAQILDLMSDLQKQLGMAIIMITHDLGVVAQMCDEVVVMYAGSICEQGTADEIFYNPCHEYTKGLMRSIPTAANNGQRLQPITGTPIDLLNMPKGCPFAPRCENALKVCLTQRPEKMIINDDHHATCWMNVKHGVDDGSITLENTPAEGGEDHE